MKVGLIGLGRMGEGMSRRMMKQGIEVWGYRRNYAKAEEAYEKGYVSGVAASLESLVQVVHNQEGMVGKAPGIFQLVIPAELVEDTLNELLPLLEEGDIIIDHSTTDIRKCQELELYCSKLGISYIFSGVYGAPYAIDTCSKIFQSLSPGNIK